MFHANTPKNSWNDAHIINQLFTHQRSQAKFPLELLTKIKPNISHLKAFGFVHYICACARTI